MRNTFSEILTLVTRRLERAATVEEVKDLAEQVRGLRMDLFDAGQEDSFDGDVARKVARMCKRRISEITQAHLRDTFK